MYRLICEITRAACEYKKNTKGGEEEKNCQLKEIFYAQEKNSKTITILTTKLFRADDPYENELWNVITEENRKKFSGTLTI